MTYLILIQSLQFFSSSRLRKVWQRLAMAWVLLISCTLKQRNMRLYWVTLLYLNLLITSTPSSTVRNCTSLR